MEIAAKLDIPIDAIHGLQRVHKLGKKPKTAKANPRGIIAQFVFYKKRQEYIKNRKKLKGTKISICEDLSPTRYELYNYIRKKFHTKMNGTLLSHQTTSLSLILMVTGMNLVYRFLLVYMLN